MASLSEPPSFKVAEPAPSQLSIHVITHRLPAQNEIPFLGAAGRLPNGIIMGMEVRRAVRNGVLRLHVPLKPLMQIASLGNVNRRPITVRQLLGINVNARQRFEGSAKRMDRELILLAGLPGPVVRQRLRLLRMNAATE